MDLGGDSIFRCGGAGGLLEAQQLFDHLPCRTIVSWNALLAGYVDNGFHAEALECFRRMEEDPGLISPSAVTYGSVLKACAHIGSLEVGEIIHAKVRDQGLLNHNLVLGTALIDMYAKCGALETAHHVFNELPHGNVFLLERTSIWIC